MEPNYFTCTLGQAVQVNNNRPQTSNINTFIDDQATKHPELPAVGFAILSNDKTTKPSSTVYTFRDIQRGSIYISQLASNQITNVKTSGQTTVALLCPSTPEFLFTWLGLMRLGHAVLLIAPQCQPSAIAHLCQTCEVVSLFYDESYAELAENSVKVAKEVKTHEVSSVPLSFSTASSDFVKALEKEPENIPQPELAESAIGYLHHTSGTSTGMPKPIPQSHRAGLGVLPRFDNGSSSATFTTTPLYHGGVADSFRAWTSGAMIWLFPGKGNQIIARNIVTCLDIANEEFKAGRTPAVKYFASVPYVLQLLAADTKGLKYLQDMDIAGVGGAALPAEAGDELVKKGVNLISRFGSAECGFLMSSHRDYENDKEWSYLRSGSGMEKIKFEEQDDGLVELIVLEGWPHKAKTNREDGSFATSDLFAPHSTIPNAYKYHSRSDSQLTLITGKKFDPAPQEASIATSDLLDDVLIFGNGRPFPGALLFRSEKAKDMPEEELVSQLAPAIEKLNRESQDHARIARNMLVILEHGQNRLEKSSKGTILRNKAEEAYSAEIEGAYTGLTASLSEEVSDQEVTNLLKEKIEGIVSKGNVETEEDLHSYGVDSVASIQIRYTLRQLLPRDAEEPPLSIVEDCGTIAKLSDYVVKSRHGEDYSAGGDNEDETQLMQELAEQYGNFKDLSDMPHLTSSNGTPQSSQPEHKGEVIVLTGATGALGAHILNFYRLKTSVSEIYCLVRGATPLAATERVNKSLTSRGLPALQEDKVKVLPCKLSDPQLGLSNADYTEIAQIVTGIVHLAWAVNFRMRLRSFAKDHLGGLRHLILLAVAASKVQDGSSAPRFAFCSSVASVAAYTAGSSIAEQLSRNPGDAGPLGYSRSKWVAEAICARAVEQVEAFSFENANNMAIFRVGQLSGDMQKGVWNTKEAWPLMLGSVRATGALPDLSTEPLGWLPVDVAAKGMIEAIESMAQNKTAGQTKPQAQVFHLLNDDQNTTWQDLLSWAKKGAKEKFDLVPPAEWVKKMEIMQQERPEHPALALLGLWKKAYGEKQVEGGSEEEKVGMEAEGKTAGKFETTKTKEVTSALRELETLDERYFEKIWLWIMDNVEE